jgi:2-polyprenyl-3-methyl-5-hydroxy-6-metoxy-1,4-benzoquinol methylase
MQVVDNSAAVKLERDKFAFGKNWSRFLATIDETRIAAASSSMRSLLGVETLEGKRFLDAGCGSALFSLAASRLGASVTSIDIDVQCVACAHEMKRRFSDNTCQWTIRRGSLLDTNLLDELGSFEVVYCWGVAHHTGDMWTAIENLLPRVSEPGTLVLAIYNDQQYISRLWSGVKQIYQRLPSPLKIVWAATIGSVLFLKRFSITLLACVLRLITMRNPMMPMLNWYRESQGRGMHPWYDLVDWVGGWPFEVAKPEAVFRFMRDRGFALQEIVTVSGHGCNEFVFRRRSVGTE